MPSIDAIQLPPPCDARAFEDLAEDALRVRWRTNDLHRIGRSGQTQHGVDSYYEDREGRHIGVQFKIRERIRERDVDEWVANAESFDPPLDEFYVATSASRDATIQQHERDLNAVRKRNGAFRVRIIFWEDLVQDLATDPERLLKHYPSLRPVPEERYMGLTFDEMLDVLAGRVVRCDHYEHEENLLKAFLARIRSLADQHGIRGGIPPEKERHFAYAHVARELAERGLAEAFWEVPHWQGWTEPAYRLSETGHRFFNRLLVEHQKEQRDGEADEQR